MKKIPQTDLDYIEVYASQLKNNRQLFEQQRMLINSQIKSSRELFLNKFGRKEFKKNARKYLKEIGLI